jgi:tetratricopeptide (TPR) repeat protein
MLARAYNSLTVAQQILGEPGIGYEFRLQAADVAQRIGDDALIRWFRLVLADHRYRRGEWDDASREVDDFLAAVEAGSPNILAYQGYGFRAEMRLARGDVPGALADAEASLAAARIVSEIQAVGFALTAGAHVFSRADAPERAREVARELLDLLRSGTLLQFAVVNLPLFVSAVVRLGLGDELLDVLRGYPETRWTEAARAYLTGDFVGAANVLQEIEVRPDEAEARLRAGEQLLAQGRPGEANEQLGMALAFYRSVGAVRYVDECEALLAEPA